MFAGLYQSTVIEKPRTILALLILCLLFFGYYTKDFRLDASSDTLLIENDPDLKYLREVTDRYGAKEFLVLTFTPKESLISDSSINNLLNLKKEIQNFDWVHSVITILDIPLLNNSDKPLSERLENIVTLKNNNVDRDKGFNEIVNSPVFRNFVVSEDGTTTGIIVNIKKDKKLKNLIIKNNEFKERINNKEKVNNYDQFNIEFENYKNLVKKKNHENIVEIRKLIQNYDEIAKIHLGGIPMIADDMMSFIKNDIVIFGAGVFLFIVATLWFIFRKLVWIIVPLSSCFFAVVIMTGLLGMLGWKVTVISSNFIALMLILTMAMNIHMSVRYLQIKKNNSDIPNSSVILITTAKMFWPILYTVLTTICAFLSLIFSEIKPIIDFGWMMTLGLITSFFVTFTLLPTILNFLSEDKIEIKEESKSIVTNFLANVSIYNSKTIFSLTSLIIILSIVGISKLEVENSFINYFNKNTEIYKGMKLIDDKLGGTTPLEIILKFPAKVQETKEEDVDDWGEDDDLNNEKYWFTKDKIDKIEKVHNYLDKLDGVGKVLSFSSIIKVAEQLNNNKKLGTLEMGVLYTKIPNSIKKEIVDPYISIKDKENTFVYFSLEGKMVKHLGLIYVMKEEDDTPETMPYEISIPETLQYVTVNGVRTLLESYQLPLWIIYNSNGFFKKEQEYAELLHAAHFFDEIGGLRESLLDFSGKGVDFIMYFFEVHQKFHLPVDLLSLTCVSAATYTNLLASTRTEFFPAIC